MQTISREELDRSLAIPDLSDPLHGPHAMQALVETAHETLAKAWRCQRLVYRATPIVSVRENYDDLGYPPGGAARDARYTRYVSATTVLRTQASASIPTLLRSLVHGLESDVLLAVPGLTYRRDVIDRHHVGEPHQLDLWRITRGSLGKKDLLEMIDLLMKSLLPGRKYRMGPASHPYTEDGLQIDVSEGDGWIEVGECGLASRALLERSGYDISEVSGLALGLGLDRLLMLRKGIPDIRLLRSKHPNVQKQMLDLSPYKHVSNQPSVTRDLSIATDADRTAEEIGDKVRAALGADAESLEALEIVSETAYEKLPKSARARMGVRPGQKNLLVRLVIRHPTATLTADQANDLRDRVYRAIHEGDRRELTK